MKKQQEIIKIICILSALFVFKSGAEQIPDAEQILKKVDEVLAAPKDQVGLIKVSIINKGGEIKYREIQLYQKGNEKRLVKVLSPADQKGIGFLSLPNEVLYVYLPAYKKTRRIAAHIKNQKFVGTDFTYEDLEVKNYSEKWEPELIKTEKECYILKLTPKLNASSDYSQIMLYVRIEDNFPVKAEYYNKKGEMIKIMETQNIEKIKSYLVATRYCMQDLRSGNKTEMEMTDIKLDTGLDDNIFTERNLAR